MAFSDLLHKLPTGSSIKYLSYGILIGIGLSFTATSVKKCFEGQKSKQAPLSFDPRPIKLQEDEIVDGVAGLIGNTPLVRINSLSNALGVEIIGKAEFMNPGGSVKDRVALQMITDAEHHGLLHPHTGSRIFEGTVGSTGISIATIARAKGYGATIIMPDDVADEKVKALLALGAHVERVRPTSIVDKKQFVVSVCGCNENDRNTSPLMDAQNLARERAKQFGNEESRSPANHYGHPILDSTSAIVTTRVEDALANGASLSQEEQKELKQKPRGFFTDQFENPSNFYAHLIGTGPEIWRQTRGRIDAFVSGAGTGGTIAGTGRYLLSKNKNLIIALSDPEGSGLFNKVKYGVMFDHKEAEGTKRRHQVDTVVEGIGINRLTYNFKLALPDIDDAFRITDEEAVAMSRYLVHHDGLFLGSSSACNLIACIKLVKKMKWNNGQRVVTILCDSGSRHYSKFWNNDYLAKANIPIDMQLIDRIVAGEA